MEIHGNLHDESIAYALAAGLVAFDPLDGEGDQDGEKLRRRQRYERRRGNGK